MSDDLISRRALLEAIDSSFVTPILKINMREEHKAVSKIWEIIVNMPTAFDKEKVIAEMNETKNIVEAKIKKAYVTRDEVSFYLNSGASDMAVEFIDIVEKGGIE